MRGNRFELPIRWRRADDEKVENRGERAQIEQKGVLSLLVVGGGRRRASERKGTEVSGRVGPFGDGGWYSAFSFGGIIYLRRLFPQSALIAFLLPLGLWLTLVASAQRKLEPRAAAAGFVALAVSSLTYLAVGFGLMFGGVGILGSGQRQFSELSAYFALPVDGGVWAIAGLKGFFLEGVTHGKGLFVAWLPLAQACATLAAVSLWRRHSLLAIGVAAALATLAFSVAGMATWGGGIGATLATQLRLGHGPVDFGGLGIAGVIAGTFALLASRRTAGQARELPESPHPFRAAIGIGLAIIGAASVLAANPLTPTPEAAGPDYAIVIVTAAGVACLASLGYSVFVSKRPSIETVTASVMAALIAVSSGAMSLPIWAAGLLGLASALSVIGGGFLWNGKIDGADTGPGVPRLLIPAALGLLTAGIAATGVYGAGVNGIGADAYLGTRGLGLSGLIGAAGGIADPGQVTAQLAMLLLCVGVAVVLGVPLRLFTASEDVTQPETAAAAAEVSVEAVAQASAPEAPIDVSHEPVPVEADEPPPVVARPLAPVFAGAPETLRAAAAPATPPTPPAPPPKTVQSAATPTTPAAQTPPPTPVIRAPNLLERLRGSRPVEKPKPIGQARRVAYPVRVGGRRLILRAMPPENKPPEEAKDADQP